MRSEIMSPSDFSTVTQTYKEHCSATQLSSLQPMHQTFIKTHGASLPTKPG